MSERAEGFKPGGFGCGDGPHLHKPVEAAALLGIGESTLRKRAAARTVACTFPAGSRRLMFSDDDLRQIIADGSKQPRPAPKRASAPRRTRRTR